MEIPGVGALTLDEDLGWYYSEPVEAGALRGANGRLVLTWDFETEGGAAAVHEAVADFLTAGRSVLEDARAEVFAYYRESAERAREQGWGDDLPDIPGPEQVWDHVQIGDEFQVMLGDDGARVHVLVECECDWDPEHGLQLVLHGGRLSKVGPCDGNVD